MDIECVAGRVVSRPEIYRGLDWATPCPREGIHELPFDPPWPLCTPHYHALVDDLYENAEMQRLMAQMGYVVG